MGTDSNLVRAVLCGLLFSYAASEATELCGILDQRSYNFYFSSGNYTFNDGQTWHNSSSLYTLLLDKPFDVSGPIPLDLLEISPLPSDELAGGMSPIAGGAAGTFFYDHTTLYAYGGIIGGNANGTQNGLWTYNISGKTWELTIVEGGALSFGDDTEGFFANDPGQALSFYTGGWEMAYNNTNNGIVRFDSSDPSQPQWNFQTAQGTMQGPDMLKGSMVFVRKGQAGILVAFGGYNTTQKGTEFAAGWDWDQNYFSDIFVYDIFSNSWYLVEATGDLPSRRSEFCSVVSSVTDDTSFQITMHGGWDQFSGDAFDDVYVLTLPAFVWIKVDAQNDPDNGVGRNRHMCNMYSDAQMIVSGGGLSGPYCNRSHPPIKVLDTSTYIWQTQFRPDNLEYSVPSVVTAVVGGGSSAGATIKEPKGGWNDSALGEIFSHTVARDTYVYPNSSAPNRASPTPSSSVQPSSSNDTGAIAGGVVGGVVVLAILALAIWFFTWRPRHRKNQQERRAELPGQPSQEVRAKCNLRPGEMDAHVPPAQLETKTDRAELDAYEYAVAMQGVQSPVELESVDKHRREQRIAQ